MFRTIHPRKVPLESVASLNIHLTSSHPHYTNGGAVTVKAYFRHSATDRPRVDRASARPLRP